MVNAQEVDIGYLAKASDVQIVHRVEVQTSVVTVTRPDLLTPSPQFITTFKPGKTEVIPVIPIGVQSGPEGLSWQVEETREGNHRRILQLASQPFLTEQDKQHLRKLLDGLRDSPQAFLLPMETLAVPTVTAEADRGGGTRDDYSMPRESAMDWIWNALGNSPVVAPLMRGVTSVFTAFSGAAPVHAEVQTISPPAIIRPASEYGLNRGWEQPKSHLGDAAVPLETAAEITDQTRREADFKPGVILVKFNKEMKLDQVQAITGMAVKKHFPEIGLWVLETGSVERTETLSVIDRLMAMEDVLYAEPNHRFSPAVEVTTSPPTDPLLSEQWNLWACQFVQTWDVVGKTGPVNGAGQVIFVVDSGSAPNYELLGQIAPGINFVEDGHTTATDGFGHGTKVTGVPVARANRVFMVGAAWEGEVAPYRVCDDYGICLEEWIVEAVVTATSRGAKIINISLLSYDISSALWDAVRYAYNRGCLVVAGAGNDNTNRMPYPAGYPEVMAVGGIDPNLQRRPTSNYGFYLDVMAPAGSIITTLRDGGIGVVSGTSFAAPHVAAEAALIWQAHPEWTLQQVWEAITTTCTDMDEPGPDWWTGHGYINAYYAVTGFPSPTPTPSPTATPTPRWRFYLPIIFK